jgi:hypothetical protein
MLGLTARRSACGHRVANGGKVEVAHWHAAQVPPPVDGVLPWETVAEDGTVFVDAEEDGEGQGLIGSALGLLGHGIKRLASAIGHKLHVL